MRVVCSVQLRNGHFNFVELLSKIMLGRSAVGTLRTRRNFTPRPAAFAAAAVAMVNSAQFSVPGVMIYVQWVNSFEDIHEYLY